MTAVKINPYFLAISVSKTNEKYPAFVLSNTGMFIRIPPHLQTRLPEPIYVIIERVSFDKKYLKELLKNALKTVYGNIPSNEIERLRRRQPKMWKSQTWNCKIPITCVNSRNGSIYPCSLLYKTLANIASIEECMEHPKTYVAMVQIYDYDGIYDDKIEAADVTEDLAETLLLITEPYIDVAASILAAANAIEFNYSSVAPRVEKTKRELEMLGSAELLEKDILLLLRKPPRQR